MSNKNKFGRVYQSGKSLSEELKALIRSLHNQGLNYAEIERVVLVSHQTIGKVLEPPSDSLIYRAISRRTKCTQDVITAVQFYKYSKPSMYLKEIQERLVSDGISTRENVPSVTSLYKILNNVLNHTYKKLKKCPEESMREDIQNKFDEFMEVIHTKDPLTLHCFDESSVLRTTANRNYGTSLKGERAIELQKFASNATYTINLLHSPFGVDNYNIIDGPSNGMHLLDFFEDTLTLNNAHGVPILSPGDSIIMDNCGFHHGRQTEANLRQLFQRHGLTLIFQPPYHPDLNTCENCFNDIKCYLKKQQTYSFNYTEMAICDGVETITPAKSYSYFKYCGYI